MVTQLGMGDALGVMSIESRASQFLGGGAQREVGEVSVAERTAERIDTEVKQILDDAHQKARRIIADRRQVLERVASRLLKQEVLEGDELRALLDRPMEMVPPSA